jgi:hypothetical protein
MASKVWRVVVSLPKKDHDGQNVIVHVGLFVLSESRGYFDPGSFNTREDAEKCAAECCNNNWCWTFRAIESSSEGGYARRSELTAEEAKLLPKKLRDGEKA